MMNPSEPIPSQKTTKTPSQDAQGRWDDLLSPREVLTEQEIQSQSQDKPIEVLSIQVRKKCRGNRKAQRQRRKLRRQAEKMHCDEDVIGTMADDLANLVEEDGQQQVMTVSFLSFDLASEISSNLVFFC